MTETGPEPTQTVGFWPGFIGLG
uniref:Uncharacterized protein n=1 Tax=Anguilla anguilla TaxID=7936 RepID=A0A0E9W3M7_ANGAN